MRVKAAGGEYMVDPDEPRLMKRADPKKGETGVYKLFTEGTDNDGDGFINEDPPGGRRHQQKLRPRVPLL